MSTAQIASICTAFASRALSQPSASPDKEETVQNGVTRREITFAEFLSIKRRSPDIHGTGRRQLRSPEVGGAPPPYSNWCIEIVGDNRGLRIDVPADRPTGSCTSITVKDGGRMLYINASPRVSLRQPHETL